TALLATLGVVATPFVARTGLPIPLIAVIAVQIIAIFISREIESHRQRRGWWMALACTSMLLPALAMQWSVARTPFTSLLRGSAWTLIWITLGVTALIVAMCVWAASVSTLEPASATILWAPAALLVPAVMTAPGGAVTETGALRSLAFACVVGAIVTMIHRVIPSRRWVPLVGIAFAATLILVAIERRGLGLAQGSGAVVVLIAAFMLVLAAFTIAAVPVISLVLLRLEETAVTPPKREPLTGPMIDR
ncbi:MAG: hypothetical protein ACKOCK_01350, partial [Chloroflexota bacterium]